jgi:phage terminase small subunit
MTAHSPWKPPRHLEGPTRRWLSTLAANFELESHHHRLLALLGDAWDRGQQARRAIATHGTTYTDRFGQPRARPEVAIERDARIAFARLLRELALDVDPPADSRPPAMAGRP